MMLSAAPKTLHPDLPGTVFVIWLSRHQWSLIQTGEAKPEVAQILDRQRSIMATVEVDAAGEPHVIESWIAARMRFGFRRRLVLPPGAQVVVRFADD